MATQFTDATFVQDTAQGMSIIDMYADWCGPCKMMAPIFDELAKEYEGKVKMGKMNVDENPVVPQQFGVQSIPTIIFMKDGKEVGRGMGFMPKEGLLMKMKEYLGV